MQLLLQSQSLAVSYHENSILEVLHRGQGVRGQGRVQKGILGGHSHQPEGTVPEAAAVFVIRRRDLGELVVEVFRGA